MLTAMFVSAVFEFGKIDLIGHTLIVVVLFGIIADDGGKQARVRDSVAAAGRLCGGAGAVPGGLLRRARRAVRHVDPLIAA